MNATNTPLQKEEGFQNMKKYIFTLYIILCALTMQAQHQVASFFDEYGTYRISSTDFLLEDEYIDDDSLIEPMLFGEFSFATDYDTIAHTAVVKFMDVSSTGDTIIVPDTVQMNSTACVVTGFCHIWTGFDDQRHNGHYTTVLFPRTVKDIHTETMLDNPNLASIVVDENNPYFTTIDGVLYDKKVERLILFPQAKAGKFVLPKTVKMIDEKAFYNCHELNYIEVEEGNKVYRSLSGLLLKKNTLIAYPVLRKGYFDVRKKDTKKDEKEDNKISNTTGWHYFNNDCPLIFPGECFIPVEVTSIAPWAITNKCINEYTVEKNHKYYCTKGKALYSKDGKTLVMYPGQWHSRHIIVPEGVTAIGPRAFYENLYMRELTLPSTLKTIGEKAFYGTDSLYVIFTYAQQVLRIGEEAFCDNNLDCKKMYAYTQLCRKYNKDFELNINAFPLFAGEGEGYRNWYVSVPDRLLVCNGTFPSLYEPWSAYAPVIERVCTWGESLRGENAFSNLTNVIAYETPGHTDCPGEREDGVLMAYTHTIWGDEPVSEYKNIIAFPAARTGDYVIPDYVKGVADGAFSNCHLSTLTISDSVHSIGIFINKGDFERFIVTPGNKEYYAIDGVLYDKSGYIIAYPRRKQDSCYTVQEGIIGVATGAFLKNPYIQEVHVTDNVKYIECDAFSGCRNLKTLYINAVTPPSIYSEYDILYDRRSFALFYLPGQIKIFVPEESVEAYKTDIHWKIYADQIFPMPKNANE